MAATLFPQPLVQFLDDNGDPLSGGKVYFYEPGTSTPKDTYTDQAAGTANANPVILNSRGEAAIWLNGFYKVNLTASDDTQVTGYPVDNQSSGSASTSTTQTEWTSPGDTPTYISSTSFSVPGDQSTVYQVGRRIKCTVGASTYYGVITVVAYTTLTTVTISLDSGSLTSSLTVVDVGILTVTNPSVPESVRSVASATASGHATNAGQIQGGLMVFDDDTGAADAYVGTLAPAITAYGEDMEVCIKIVNANTVVAPTLNLNALGAKTIKRINGAALLVGDLPADHYAVLRYDGTDFILMNPALHTHLDANNGGVILQVVNKTDGAVNTGTGTIATADGVPQNTDGDQYMELAITPKSTTNKLKIDIVCNVAATINDKVSVALFQDSTASALEAVTQRPQNSNEILSFAFTHYMAAGTTSETTFKVRAGAQSAGTTTFNGESGARIFGGVMASSITITETPA